MNPLVVVLGVLVLGGAAAAYALGRKAGTVAVGKPLRTLTGVRLTHYYRHYCEPGSVPVYDLNGQVLDYVSTRSIQGLLMEGTGVLPNGTIVNYGDGSRWRVLPPGSWGLGVGGRKLQPGLSIAVDRSVIPLDSLVYCRETGAWYKAHDVGEAIKGLHVDLFTGDPGSTLERHPDWVTLDIYPASPTLT